MIKRLLLIGALMLLAVAHADAVGVMGSSGVSLCSANSLADSGGTFKMDTGGAFNFTCSGP